MKRKKNPLAFIPTNDRFNRELLTAPVMLPTFYLKLIKKNVVPNVWMWNCWLKLEACWEKCYQSHTYYNHFPINICRNKTTSFHKFSSWTVECMFKPLLYSITMKQQSLKSSLFYRRSSLVHPINCSHFRFFSHIVRNVDIFVPNSSCSTSVRCGTVDTTPTSQSVRALLSKSPANTAQVCICRSECGFSSLLL